MKNSLFRHQNQAKFDAFLRSKNTENSRFWHFFLQIQSFYKFFARDNDLIYSSINPYL